ncbi:TetR/AcrR family transcriptional regulator [Microlunatus speluncae]|uniref:TetR/AcrR family transcriptional regulator n=1 Tax=Microlunatus speluncae TaxID=2594267 RepID=UPI00126669E2|nr:TetR family transcriptional regulator [Microlunatus speluncae]
MSHFRRARSEEQRAERRAAILGVAATMLADRPVADLSLNELARQVGLAKSNVLRYFDSREAILLELLDAQSGEWLATLEAARPSRGGLPTRCRRLAELITASLAERPVLCDLISAQTAVLERNVSVDVAIRHKRSSLANIKRLTEVVRSAVPELAEPAAVKFAAATLLTAGALWTHQRPSEAMLAAYCADPELAALRIDFHSALGELLTVILTGLLDPTCQN